MDAKKRNRINQYEVQMREKRKLSIIVYLSNQMKCKDHRKQIQFHFVLSPHVEFHHMST